MKLLDADSLLDRLLNDKPTLFVVGAALSADVVPDSLAMVERVLTWFEGRRWRRRGRARALRTRLEALPPFQRYRVAFDELLKTAGQSTANQLVRDAVHEACGASLPLNAPLTSVPWTLPPGMRALGRYAALAPDNFARVIITSNFDPLIEVAVREAGGQVVRDVVARDGDLQVRATESRVRVVHVHGYWRGDTLHSATQHDTRRPKLAQSLQRLFRGHQVVVLGYGGADDAMLQALRNVARDPSAECDVLWAFHSDDPDRIRTRYAGVLTALEPAQHAGRAFFYGGIDAHTLLPELVADCAPRPFLDPDQPAARDALFKHLYQRIEKRGAVQLVGAPYMGKTAILNQVQRRLQAQHRVARLDARSVARTPAGFVQGIGDALGERVATWQALNTRQAVPDETDAVAALKDLLPCVVLIDNADELTLAGHGFSSGFFDHLRPLVQDGSLMWISASVQNLKDQFARTSVSSPFLNDAEVQYVGELEPSVRAALAKTVDDDAAVDAILAEAGPHALPLMWWARNWTRGPVEVLRPEFRTWVRSLYDLWWPEKNGAVLKAALTGSTLAEHRRLVAREFENRGLVHASAAWRAYVDAR